MIPKEQIKGKSYLTNDGKFIGKITLLECYQINVKEVQSYTENYCQNCEWSGLKQCFYQATHDCGDAERDKYSDSVWIFNQRESMKRRKEERKRKRDARMLVFIR